MSSSMEGRSRNIDFLKGISIIVIFMYHFFGEKYFKNGYLGVDVFFVISGFLLIKGINRKLLKGDFKYFEYIKKKVVRLMPLIVSASIISLVLGYILMLPDDYENLSESVVASLFFSNNILECITTKNYWNISNQFKPLMHLWYIGVLMKAYIIIPIFYIICEKLIRNKNKYKNIYVTIILSMLSFLLFIFYKGDSSLKFYLLPFRMFEITIGGLISFKNDSKVYNNSILKLLYIITYIVLIFFLCSNISVNNNSIMIIIIVFLTSVILYYNKDFKNKSLKIITKVGEKSYSIYIWHQIIMAFIFYSVFYEKNILCFISVLVLTIIFSLISYRFFEVNNRILSGGGSMRNIVIISFAVFMISLWIYTRSGVVRNVPELDINVHDIHRHMHSEYCDRPYNWDSDFDMNNNKIKVLVIGNSYARDWANILYEYNDTILEISYLFYRNGVLEDNKSRLENADYIFYAFGPDIGCELPEDLYEMADHEKLYIIGNKKYGFSNGIIYAHRKSKYYFSQTVTLDNELLLENKKNIELWGEHYIDMISPIQNNDGTIQVFTDNCKFISQDCSHLTYEGAKYYSRLLNINKYIK